MKRFLIVGFLIATLPAFAGVDRGDLVITEAMIRSTNTYCEWLEVVNTSGSNISLENCFLYEGEIGGTFEYYGFETGYDVVAANNNTGNPALFTRNTGSCMSLGAEVVDCVGWDEAGTCIAKPDVLWKSLSFGNSGDRITCLVCPESGTATPGGDCSDPGAGMVVVDELAYNWEDDWLDLCDETLFPGRCSIEFCPSDQIDSSSADENDNKAMWSISPLATEENTYYVPDDYDNPMEWYLGLGTPGETNMCVESFILPNEGELVFTEVAGVVAGGNEWFEMHSTVDHVLNINTCVLYKYAKDSEDNISSEAEYIFTDTSGPIEIQPDAYQVFSAESCLFDNQDTGSVSCENGEIIFDNVSFPNDSTWYMELKCNDLVIDKISFNFSYNSIETGRSAQLMPDLADPVTANDSWENWCEAPLSEAIPELQFTEEGKCNYGTPGAQNNCTTPTYEYKGEIPRRCSTTGELFGWLVSLMGILIVSRRKRNLENLIK